MFVCLFYFNILLFNSISNGYVEIVYCGTETWIGRSVWGEWRMHMFFFHALNSFGFCFPQNRHYNYSLLRLCLLRFDRSIVYSMVYECVCVCEFVVCVQFVLFLLAGDVIVGGNGDALVFRFFLSFCVCFSKIAVTTSRLLNFVKNILKPLSSESTGELTIST